MSKLILNHQRITNWLKQTQINIHHCINSYTIVINNNEIENAFCTPSVDSGYLATLNFELNIMHKNSLNSSTHGDITYLLMIR